MKRFILNSKGLLIKCNRRALQGGMRTLNSFLNNELYLPTIGASIDMFEAMKEKNNSTRI